MVLSAMGAVLLLVMIDSRKVSSFKEWVGRSRR